MHNIKSIRENKEIFRKKLEDRNLKVSFKELLDLDKKNRELIQNKEKLEQEKKIISQNKDKSQFDKSKKISKEIEEINKNHTKIKEEINIILNSLPNIALEDVPIGKNENENQKGEKDEKRDKKEYIEWINDDRNSWVVDWVWLSK